MQASFNQKSLAASLDIQTEESASLDQLVENIEQALGERRLQELCRWFIVSAYRFQQRGDWTEPDGSGLSIARQYALADSYLESKENRNSLQAVLRDPRFRFTLVNFGKNRNVESLTLSSSTKAFRHAQHLLSRLASQPQPDVETIAEEEAQPGEEALVVDRRARRRGFTPADNIASVAAESLDPIRVVAPSDEPDSVLNDAEYQELEEELEDAAPAEDRSFSYRSNEDKISLLLGMASGLVLFLLALWVF